MTSEPLSSDFFTAGGTLPPDAPSYVKRPTDDDLFRHITAGEFCYILTPRQMGKSSLMIRTAQRLQSKGVRSAIVDLTVIGTVESEDQWYKGILTQIRRRLRLNIDPVNWWEQRKDIPQIQKFIAFFEEVLSEVSEHVVIFIDEIDTTLKLDFRDDFFAGIRAIFNARAEDRNFKRITFVLLGVASPSDLIKDRNRTPFNIGQEILLRPFSRVDAQMLEKGLEEIYPNHGRKILDRIFYWTNGHPYLTQKLCQSVVEHRLNDYTDHEIDGLVHSLFVSEEASRETNLQFVRDNLLSYPERRVILSLHKRLLRGIKVHDNKNSLPQNHLKLSGLASVENGILIVSNRIYRKVFDVRWVNRYTEVNWSLVASGVLSVIVIFLGYIIYNDASALPSRAQKNIDNLAIYKDDRGIQYLADLFRMRPYLFPNEYEYKAKDTFFNAFGSWEEQKLLLEIAYGEPHPPPEDYKIVLNGLYTSLADVDYSGQTTQLLEVMHNSLKEMGLQDEVVFQEIGYWLEARKRASEDNLNDALNNYTNAINLNVQNANPAILFERARIYTRLRLYEAALKDYEQVIAIIPESNIEPTEAATTTPSAGTTEAITSAFTLTATLSPTVGPTTTRLVLPTNQLRTPLPATANAPVVTGGATSATASAVEATPTQLPTVTPLPFPIQPKFLTRGQRISAVNNDIKQNQSLISLLSQARPEDYPNLTTNIPVLTATATTPPSTNEALTETPTEDITYEGLKVDAPNCDYGGAIRSIEAVDELTVKFILCVPDSAFPAKIAFTSFAIQPQEHLESTGGRPLENPIGTGPYKFESWEPGNQLIFTRFEDYWGEPAMNQTLVFRWGTESSQRLLELQSGTVDGVDNVSPDDFGTAESDPTLQLIVRPALNIFYIGFNNNPQIPGFDNSTNPLANEQVRQAIARGIDRQRIVDNFYPPGSEVASHFAPCSIPNGCVGEAWYEFDPDAAKALLAEAGYPNGFETVLTYRDVVRSYLPDANIVAEDIQVQLKENLNVTVKTEVMESGAFIEAVSLGQLAGIHLFGWGADYPDQTNFLGYHFGEEASLQFGDKFEDITSALSNAARVASTEERAPFYEAANNAIKQHVPMIPVAHSASSVAFKSTVESAHASPLGNENFAVMGVPGQDTFVWMQNFEPISLYCADETDSESFHACEQVTQSLLGYEVGGTAVEPVLAESYEPNSDLTEWTFHLRRGVIFHDGSSLDANDVVTSLVVQWDASHPLHTGNAGGFEYWLGLFGTFLNMPPQ